MKLPRATGPARQATIREHNLSVVLDVVLHADLPISRAGLATVTGLTRATVSALVDDLIAAELLAEVGQSRSGVAGRPATGLVAARRGPVGIGLEINVDHLAVCAVDLAGQISYELVAPSDQRGMPPAEALARAAALAAEAKHALSTTGRSAVGAALAVAGLVQGQLVRVAPNLDWHDVSVPSSLGGLPLLVDNEANFAALGELAAMRNASEPDRSRSFLYVSGEVGIGAGLVLAGALMRGRNGFAGELGHVCVRPDGPRCSCGAYGCLEQYAGQDAIVRAALGGGGTVTDLAALALAGDARVIAALEIAGTALGVALAGTVNVLDITDVALGGVFAPLTAWLAPAVQRELDARVLAARWSAPRVRSGALGGRAAVRGAAEAALDAVRHHPARFIAPR
jgi:predicted NBD/HSP70 family sugar kinase